METSYTKVHTYKYREEIKEGATSRHWACSWLTTTTTTNQAKGLDYEIPSSQGRVATHHSSRPLRKNFIFPKANFIFILLFFTLEERVETVRLADTLWPAPNCCSPNLPNCSAAFLYPIKYRVYKCCVCKE